MNDSKEYKKIYCNICSGHTNHCLKSTHEAKYEEIKEIDGEQCYEFFEESIYKFWYCKGCDTAILEDNYTNSSLIGKNDKRVYSSTFSPKRKNIEPKTSKLIPKAFKNLRISPSEPVDILKAIKPSDIERTYIETIKAFNFDLPMLCAVGIRTLLEIICEKQGITDTEARGLKGKLKIFKEKEHLPENIVEGLSELKFLGDKAVHQRITATKQELKLSINIIEDILNRMYEIDYKINHNIKSLSASIEKRKTSGHYPQN